MAPGVAPAHEVVHGHHRNQEAAQEWLLTDHWKEEESQQTSGQTVFEPTQLIFRDPILTVLQVDLS